MNKIELFNYLNSGVDKSGNLKKVGGFRKHYPDLYNDFLKTDFPDELKDLPFKQKLWHFLRDTYSIPVCKVCHSKVNFLTRKGQWGYCEYCSGACAMKDDEIKRKLDETKLLRYGDKNYNNKEKQKQTISSMGPEYWEEHRRKSLETRFKKNNGKYFSKNTIKKIKETNIKKYGVDSFAKTKEFRDLIELKHDEIQKKLYETKRKNNSFNRSKVEHEFKEYLDSINLYSIPQYKSDSYNFSCDFFIPYIDLFIEIQGCWTHGGHPFDETNPDDIAKVEYWKSKNNEFYNNAIYTWTDLDVRKRKTAEKNMLNYLEIFSYDIEKCVSIFHDYIKKLIVDYCLSQDFPGTQKWPADHPIWDCNVGNKKSPRSAWRNRGLLSRAVANIIKMCERDEKFNEKFMNELMMCDIVNNTIESSTGRFLELILNRFTIAKIAPKVTALDPSTVMRMIDESGIDVSKGVYVPMSGFGGIPRGVEMWGEKHGVGKIECECYDINKRFCDHYGWVQKDILENVVVTDKVCICCPPFGKSYEHWDGTPREMSEIDFREWYRLIKEYVIAPEYIIIGPEVDSTGFGSNKGLDYKGEKISGLFKKISGVMVWNDEMIQKERTK